MTFTLETMLTYLKTVLPMPNTSNVKEDGNRPQVSMKIYANHDRFLGHHRRFMRICKSAKHVYSLLIPQTLQ